MTLFIKPKIFTSKVTTTSGGVIPVNGIVANGLMTTIPAGTMLEMIRFQNTTAFDVDINIGTTVAGSELSVMAITVLANSTNIWFNPYTDAALAAFPIYISSLAWGGASLNAKIYTRS